MWQVRTNAETEARDYATKLNSPFTIPSNKLANKKINEIRGAHDYLYDRTGEDFVEENYNNTSYLLLNL